MSWERLLAENKVRPHTPSQREIEDLFSLVDRDLQDAAYFDQCRLKRNHLEYDRSSVVSETEAQELLESASEFYEAIRSLIAESYPGLFPE